MLGMEQWEGDSGAPSSKAVCVCKRTGDCIDRETVRGCLGQERWRPYRRKAVLSRLLEAHRDRLVARASEARYSARILPQDLRAEGAFRGRYDLVKLAVRPL